MHWAIVDGIHSYTPSILSKNDAKLLPMMQDTNHQFCLVIISFVCASDTVCGRICVCGCVCVSVSKCSDAPVPISLRLNSHSSPLYQRWLIKALISTASWTTLTATMLPWPVTPGWLKRHIAIATHQALCQGDDLLLTWSAKLSPSQFFFPFLTVTVSLQHHLLTCIPYFLCWVSDSWLNIE